MNEMIELTKIDYVSVLPAAVAILAGTKAILSLLEILWKSSVLRQNGCVRDGRNMNC